MHNRQRCLTSPVRWFGALGPFVAAIALLGLSAAWASPLRRLEARPLLSSLFTGTSGWVGGDGAYTTALDPETTLWLFGDTFVGDMRDGTRHGCKMVHNTAAIQKGRRLTARRVRFAIARGSDGSVADLFSPPDGRGWFWPFAACIASGKLHVFLGQFETTDAKSVFGFRRVATWLATIADPLAEPVRWKPVYSRVPFDRQGAGSECAYGAAVVEAGGFVHVYGTVEGGAGSRSRRLVVARVAPGMVDRFGMWRFFDGSTWRPDPRSARPICPWVPTELSVSRLPSWNCWVMVHSADCFSPGIQLRFAPTPWGPWSVASTVYRCPEVGWHRTVFTYAAKAHPELAGGPGEVVVTYVANSTDFGRAVEHPQLYRPRFLRIRLEAPTP
jgi:hypothetical protein